MLLHTLLLLPLLLRLYSRMWWLPSLSPLTTQYGRPSMLSCKTSSAVTCRSMQHLAP
jgi:hypothetical protein